jgi:hypothetical protein
MFAVYHPMPHPVGVNAMISEWQDTGKADHSPLFSDEIKNVWNYKYTYSLQNILG